MKTADLDLLIKFLGMTGSASDAEALVAVRRANRKLAEMGLTWERLIRDRTTTRPRHLSTRGRAAPAEKARTGSGRGVSEEWSRR